MRVSKPHLQRVAIAIGAGIAIAASILTLEYLKTPNNCVRTLSTGGKSSGGQEVVYVWGCFNPQRFRQWSILAWVPLEVKPGVGIEAGSESVEG